MSEVLIAHPDEWIGVPEDFPNERWKTASAWAEELLDVFVESFGKTHRKQRKAFKNFLVVFAEGREERDATRGYISIDDWAGPAHLVDLVLVPKSEMEDTTLEQLAGADDPNAIETRVFEPFVTDSGLEGLHCVRLVKLPDVDQVIGWANYVWSIDDGFILLQSITTNLEKFELGLPRLKALAKAVTVVD